MSQFEFFYSGNKGKDISVRIFRLKGNFIVHPFHRDHKEKQRVVKRMKL